MSTQPIERRHVRPVASRPDLRRALSIGIVLALTFILAYVIGHTKGGAAVREHLPPSLPSVTTPVPVTLGTAPPIEVGVLQPPPPPVTQPKQTTPPPVVSATPATVAPVVTSPPPEAKAPVEPVHITSPPPTRSSPPPSGHSGGGSGGGTSFETSG
jgi:hypothetical protein